MHAPHKIRYDGESETFINFFWKLNKAKFTTETGTLPSAKTRATGKARLSGKEPLCRVSDTRQRLTVVHGQPLPS